MNASNTVSIACTDNAGNVLIAHWIVNVGNVNTGIGAVSSAVTLMSNELISALMIVI